MTGRGCHGRAEAGDGNGGERLLETSAGEWGRKGGELGQDPILRGRAEREQGQVGAMGEVKGGVGREAGGGGGESDGGGRKSCQACSP